MERELRKKLEEFYDNNVWDHSTLGETLSKLSEKYGEKIAIVDGEREISYEDLNKVTLKFANGFIRKGLKKGDRVLLQFSNRIEFIVVAFALFKVGIVPIMTLPAHRETEIKGILEKSKSKAYISQEKYLGFSYKNMIEKILREMDREIKTFIIDDYEEFEFFSEKVEVEKDDISYKDNGLILLSGGTTGVPKLIPRRHCDYLYVAKEINKRCQIDNMTVYLAALPIAHNFPLGCPGIVGTLLAGGTVVICPTTSPDEIIPLIEEYKVTITGLVPAVANMCIEFLEMDDDYDYDISSLEVIQIGGSVLEPSLAKKIETSFQCKLQQIFGIAEGLICCTDLEDEGWNLYNTQGKPISEYDEVLIVDKNGDEVEDGEFGELIVRGPYTIYGYIGLDNSEVISNKCYFKTGDKARKLKNGNYQIIGRIKEMINRAGEKIMPTELQELLLSHRDILDIQVVGIEDKSLGEKICACIIPKERKVSLSEIRNYLVKKQVAQFKLPDQVVYLKNWPLTNVGKIDKSKLKEIVKEMNEIDGEIDG